MRWTFGVALLLLSAIFGTMSCAQSNSQARKEVRVKIVHEGGAWLGVTLRDLTADLAKEKDVKTESGALVTSVVEDSPAEKAGIQEDDIIVGFRGKTIGDSDDLVKAVQEGKKGETVDVVVMRKDAKKTLQATLEEGSGTPRTFAFRAPAAPLIPHFTVNIGREAYGLRLSTLNRQLGEYFGAPNNHGVLVQEVIRRSAAEKAGFKAGDVIVKIGSETIENVHDVRSALEGYKKGDKAQFDILRKGERKTIALDITSEQHGGSYHGWNWFRSDTDVPDEIDIEEGPGVEMDAPATIEENAFHRDMQKLGQELRHLGRNLKERMQELRQKLQQELRHISDV